MNKLGAQIVELNLPCENEYYNDVKVKRIIKVEAPAPQTLSVEFYDEHDAFHVVKERIDSDVVSMYMKWFTIKTTFVGDICEFSTGCKEAVTINMTEDNVVLHAKINEDYIEKQTVQWWPLRDLKTVIKNGGYLNSEFFRAYFLPVLQRSIQEIEDLLDTIDVGKNER